MSKICVCVLTENNFQDKIEEKGAEHSLVQFLCVGGVGEVCIEMYTYVLVLLNSGTMRHSTYHNRCQHRRERLGHMEPKQGRRTKLNDIKRCNQPNSGNK